MPMYPQSSAERKNLPITEGVLDYFPDAVAYVSFVSKVGNDKHNPGQKMHWAREKSTDHRNCIARHLIEAGLYDADGLLNEGTMAWRALASLQLRLEELQRKGHNIWALYGGQCPPKARATVAVTNVDVGTNSAATGEGSGTGSIGYAPSPGNGGGGTPGGREQPRS